jgi:hypothetical protein
MSEDHAEPDIIYNMNPSNPSQDSVSNQTNHIKEEQQSPIDTKDELYETRKPMKKRN